MSKKAPTNLHPAALCDWYLSQTNYSLEGRKGTYYAPTNDSFVYVLFNCATKLYKIGITENIKAREKQISNQSGCYIDRVVYIRLHVDYDESAKYLEGMLHNFFESKRKIGEWFNLDLKCLLAIRQLFYSIEGEDMFDDIRDHWKFHYTQPPPTDAESGANQTKLKPPLQR